MTMRPLDLLALTRIPSGGVLIMIGVPLRLHMRGLELHRVAFG